MTVVRLQNIHMVVRDMDGTAAFWQRALGLSVRFRDADRWLQLKAGNDPFALAAPEEGLAGQTGAVPVFEVDDLEAHAEAILAEGGRILGERDMGDHGRVLTFCDPEGNAAQLLIRPGKS
jgi:predicted enzyme related to lactoylglutathione lyase